MSNGAETAIVWVRDPHEFTFVRVQNKYVSRRNGWAKCWLPAHQVLVGYAELGADTHSLFGRFSRRCFVVNNTDYPLGSGRDNYAPPISRLPCEAVDPLTLAPNEPGKVTERCLRDPCKATAPTTESEG